MNKDPKQYLATLKTQQTTAHNGQQFSKTRIKRHMQELQDLGIMLTKLKPEKLKLLHLPEKLFNAIKNAQIITSNGALRRQHQFIGKLMRDLNEDIIQSINCYLIQKGS